MRIGLIAASFLLSLACLSPTTSLRSSQNCSQGVCNTTKECEHANTTSSTSRKCREAVLDANAVTFLATPNDVSNAYLAIILNEPKTKPNLIVEEDYSINFRTFQATAMLIYAHDGLGNFMQIEVENTYLSCRFNHQNNIYRFFLPQTVNDGRWHNFRITKLSIELDGRTYVNPGRRDILGLVSLKLPYALRNNERVRPLQRDAAYQPKPNFAVIYVGGVDRLMSTMSHFVGCISFVRVGNRTLALKDSIKFPSTRYAMGCWPGCDKDTCLNNGICKEEWNRTFQCNCFSTAFVGQRCDKNFGHQFNGRGGMQLLMPSPVALSVTDVKLMLSSTPQFGEVLLHLQRAYKSVLLYVSSPTQLSLSLQSKGIEDKWDGSANVSFDGLQLPLTVRFTLWDTTERIKLQINDRSDKSLARKRRTFIDRVYVGDASAVDGANLTHYRGCLYNLQIFFEDSDVPLQLERNFAVIGKERFGITYLTTEKLALCPIMPPSTVATEKTSSYDEYILSAGNSSDAQGNFTIGMSTSLPLDMFWAIVVFTGTFMLMTIIIVAVFYCYYMRLKRSRTSKTEKTYTRVSSLSPDSSDLCTNRIELSNATTGNHQRCCPRPSPLPPYDVPFKSPYVATSLVLRYGKHIASVESDYDLDESASCQLTFLPKTVENHGPRIAMILQERHDTSVNSPSLRRLHSPRHLT